MNKNLDKSKIVNIISALLAILPLLITLYLFPLIPNKIPIQYWIDGTINRWGNKYELLIIPLIIVIFAVLQPKIFSLNFNYEQEDKITRYNNIYFLLLLNIFVYTTLYISINYKNCLNTFNFYNFFCCSFCFLFAFVGNYIQYCRKNSSFSIRNKYTLESEIIWNKIHKFCGSLWLSGSIVFFPLFLFSRGYYILMITLIMILTFVLLPIIYTRYLHKKYLRGELSKKRSQNQIQHSH